MHQLAESRITPDRVEVGVRLYELQDVRLLLNSLSQRGKGLFLIAETQVGVDESCRGNIAGALAFLQIGKELERVSAAAGESIGANEHARNRGTAFGEQKGSFQRNNCLIR